jgi:tRNA dimethylallyltransferase
MFLNLFFFVVFSNSDHVDYEEGILQTIGFKEFIPYLEKYDKTHDSLINRYVESAQTLAMPDGWETLKTCLEELKAVTQRYSKKQRKWIKNRFLASDLREAPPLYPLYTTDVSQWEDIVSQPAIATIESYIKGDVIELKPMEKFKRLGEGLDEETSHHCPICDRIFIGEFQFQLHLKSNKHKKTKERIRRKALKEQSTANEKTSS